MIEFCFTLYGTHDGILCKHLQRVHSFRHRKIHIRCNVKDCYTLWNTMGYSASIQRSSTTFRQDRLLEKYTTRCNDWIVSHSMEHMMGTLQAPSASSTLSAGSFIMMNFVTHGHTMMGYSASTFSEFTPFGRIVCWKNTQHDAIIEFCFTLYGTHDGILCKHLQRVHKVLQDSLLEIYTTRCNYWILFHTLWNTWWDTLQAPSASSPLSAGSFAAQHDAIIEFCFTLYGTHDGILCKHLQRVHPFRQDRLLEKYTTWCNYWILFHTLWNTWWDTLQAPSASSPLSAGSFAGKIHNMMQWLNFVSHSMEHMMGYSASTFSEFTPFGRIVCWKKYTTWCNDWILFHTLWNTWWDTLQAPSASSPLSAGSFAGKIHNMIQYCMA